MYSKHWIDGVAIREKYSIDGVGRDCHEFDDGG